MVTLGVDLAFATEADGHLPDSLGSRIGTLWCVQVG